MGVTKKERAMELKDSMTGYPMIAVLSAIMGILLGSFLVSCGSSDDAVIVPPRATQNHLFNGVYHAYGMEQDESADSPVGGYTIIANSDGTATIPGLANITYAVYSDRSITIIPGGAYEKLYGRISANGNIVAWTDTVYDVATSDVELGIAVRNSSGRTLAEMEGDYIIYQAGVKDAGEIFYTSRVGVIVDNVGTGQWGILNHSMGDTGTGSVTAIMNADGTFVMNNGLDDDYGIVSPDGNLFVLADTSNSDSDGERILSVGIRNSLTAPDVTGDFLLNQIGLSNYDPREYASRVSLVLGASTYTYQVVAHSLGYAGPVSAPMPYTVSPDGTVDEGGPVWIQATRDGGVVAFSGTDNIADDELVFGIGIR
jgi:hypothetical protein